MPDLITHCLAPRIVLLGKLKKYLLLFIVGTILPDILSRAPHLFLQGCYSCSWVLTVLHAPFILTLFILIITLVFKKNKFQVFLSLFSGMLFHLLLDSLQRHFSSGYYWFFPFSFKTWEAGLFWPETSIYFILPLLFISLLVYSLELYFRGRRMRL